MTQLTRRCWLVLAGFAGLFVHGCTTAATHQTGAPGAAFERSGVAVLADPQGGLTDDAYVIDCLTRTLRAGRPHLPVVDALEFRDALFPWFEPGRAPSDEQQLGAVLARPAVRDRIQTLGVRYLVLVGGRTRSEDQEGGIFCGGGYGGAGCLGLATYRERTSAEAKVWDLGEGRAVTTMSTDASGRAVIPAFILPIPFIPATQTAACDSAAEQLLDLLGR